MSECSRDRRQFATAAAAITAAAAFAVFLLVFSQPSCGSIGSSQPLPQRIVDNVQVASAHLGTKESASFAAFGADTTEKREAEKAAEKAAESDAAESSKGSENGGSMAPQTVMIGGTILSYTYQYGVSSPSGVGIWKGSDSTSDGSYGYFIGHNPGPFAVVMGLGYGSEVTVCDSAGAIRTYHVVDIFSVPRMTTWDDISGRVTCYGESIALQACEYSGGPYRIVVCS